MESHTTANLQFLDFFPSGDFSDSYELASKTGKEEI